jgi:hypothetical protein
LHSTEIDEHCEDVLVTSFLLKIGIRVGTSAFGGFETIDEGFGGHLTGELY